MIYEIRYIERKVMVYRLEAPDRETAEQHEIDDLELIEERPIDCEGPFIDELSEASR